MLWPLAPGQLNGVGILAVVNRSDTSATIFTDAGNTIVKPIGTRPIVRLPRCQFKNLFARRARVRLARIQVRSHGFLARGRSHLKDTLVWCGKDRLELPLQVGDVAVNSNPDFLRINLEVLMDQYVSHSHYRGPRDFRVCRPQTLGGMARRLANDLYMVYDPCLK